MFSSSYLENLESRWKSVCSLLLIINTCCLLLLSVMAPPPNGVDEMICGLSGWFQAVGQFFIDDNQSWLLPRFWDHEWCAVRSRFVIADSSGFPSQQLAGPLIHFGQCRRRSNQGYQAITRLPGNGRNPVFLQFFINSAYSIACRST